MYRGMVPKAPKAKQSLSGSAFGLEPETRQYGAQGITAVALQQYFAATGAATHSEAAAQCSGQCAHIIIGHILRTHDDGGRMAATAFPFVHNFKGLRLGVHGRCFGLAHRRGIFIRRLCRSIFTGRYDTAECRQSVFPVVTHGYGRLSCRGRNPRNRAGPSAYPGPSDAPYWRYSVPRRSGC